MIIAGLDIATRTGVCIMDGDKPIHIESFRPKGEKDAEIFHGFRIHLRSLIISHGVQYVGIEEPLRSDNRKNNDDGTVTMLTTMRTILRLYGLRAHAIEICESLGIPFQEFNQGTWRKAFMGNGKAKKEDAVRQCQMLRWNVPNKDAAEACGVAWCLAGYIRSARLVRPGDLFEGDAA